MEDNMKALTIILFFTLVAFTTAAQDKYFYINLDVNKPLSNSSWLESTSARGLRAGYRSPINDSKFSVGIDISGTTYDQYLPRRTYQNGDRAITTDYYHYIYSYSAAISGQYNLRQEGTFLPYVGIGVGANNNQYIQYYNVYEDTDTGWGFLARPEAGVLIKFGKYRRVGGMAAVHYDFSTNRSDMFNYQNFSTIGFQVGLIFFD